MNKLPKHLTKGGPGDKYLGDGKVDTSQWFKKPGIDVGPLEKQIQDQDIFFVAHLFNYYIQMSQVHMHLVRGHNINHLIHI